MLALARNQEMPQRTLDLIYSTWEITLIHYVVLNKQRNEIVNEDYSQITNM
jgi:hypothetical protein